MPLFSKKGSKNTDYKARLEHKLYLARENPEPLFDLSDCALKAVPPGIYSLCKVFRKEVLYLQENQLSSLTGGGNMCDLSALQILDLHSNHLAKLPDEVRHLKNLRVLNVSCNQLKLLPEEIGELQRLQILNVSENNLKSVPGTLGRLQHLERIDVRGNKTLSCLPDNLCRARHLQELLLDADKFTHPPPDVALNGTDAILKFLAAECGLQYECLQEEPDNSEAGCSTPCRMAGLEEKEKNFQEQKQQERLALERTIVEHHSKELELQDAMKRTKGRLLEDLAEQQSKLENEILRIHQDREIERQNLIQQLQQVENAADSVISQLLAVSANERDLAQVQNLLEHERQEEERILNICQEEYQLLRHREILKAMEDLLEEEGRRETQLREYEEGRAETARTLLSQEMESNKQLVEVLSHQGKAHSALVTRLHKDEELQRAAVATLLERGDARSWGLVQQVSLVETQLAALTAMEMGRKKLQLTEHVADLKDKRQALSLLLVKLLAQQAERRKQLMRTLDRMEQQRWLGLEDQQHGEVFWLLQYQRLLDSQSGSLMEMERALDPALARHLVLSGVIHYVPLLVQWLLEPEKLPLLTHDDLVEVGVTSFSTCKAILEAVRLYLEELERRNMKLQEEEARVPSLEPSAPPMSDIASVSSIGKAECVVCMQQECEVIFIPCGHMCCCIKCSEQLTECPMCRADIGQKVRVRLP